MATPVLMPQTGNSVESCIISKWHKKKGEKVNEGDVLFTYETDKAAFEEEAKVGGILLDVFFNEDDDVPVLTNVCVIGSEGEDTSEFNPNVGNEVKNDALEKKDTSIEVVSPEYVETPTPSINAVAFNLKQGEKIKISPRAKNLAERANVDSRYANPTGPYGRIIERDVETLIQSGPVATSAAKEAYMGMNAGSVITGTGLGGRITTSDIEALSKNAATSILGREALAQPEYEEVKLTNIRKVIAKAMQNSLSSTAQLTLNTSFDATDILNYRNKIKANMEKLGLQNITLNDMVLYAVSRTLLKHKELNAHLIDDKMHIFNNVQLGLAIDTERGLMVPTIFNSNLKSLNEISCEVKSLADECKKGSISPDYLKGGSFTITNLGALGIESFTPVLNAPQTGILGVSTITQRVKEVKGEYVNYSAMGLSLTFDHRAVDGAPAARFLQDLCASLENFSVLLAK